jgi:hypothetical protein
MEFQNSRRTADQIRHLDAKNQLFGYFFITFTLLFSTLTYKMEQMTIQFRHTYMLNIRFKNVFVMISSSIECF